MTLAMSLAKGAGMAPGELAPKAVTENLENRFGVRNRLPKSAFEASWVLSHFGYGTASGVAYALAQKAFDRERPLLLGPLFGMLLWAIGYCGWLPLLGIYPPPTQLPKRKVMAEIMATHLVYGVGTAAVHRALRVHETIRTCKEGR
jgi:uncharacterized membrane protein YagU involved in acid resistance